jgi:hypothetical protein
MHRPQVTRLRADASCGRVRAGATNGHGANVSPSIEALEAEVLRLSQADRSRLLERLIASLDADAEVEAQWDAIANDREAELESGLVQSVPFEEAIARLEARFPG